MCVQNRRHRKTTNFDDVHCRITDESGKLFAMAMKVGSLYYLDYQEITECHQANTVETKEPESKESIWHRQFGHLGVINLQKLARDMIKSFDYDASNDLTFCETCIGGKHHKSQFPKGVTTRFDEPLGLIHSDINFVGSLIQSHWEVPSTF